MKGKGSEELLHEGSVVSSSPHDDQLPAQEPSHMEQPSQEPRPLHQQESPHQEQPSPEEVSAPQKQPPAQSPFQHPSQPPGPSFQHDQLPSDGIQQDERHRTDVDDVVLPEFPVEQKHLAIYVKDLWLWYGDGPGKVEIFKGINLSVPRGGIYALLGSSGCGKTTLLRCLLGRKLFQKGEVRIFGTAPGTPGSKIPGSNVGYMPQELALFEQFSIDETLGFFGQIYNLPTKEWKERADFLLQFFELPDKTCLVKFLSGGQKRRVSLAASLVHNPPLLVLDEPTVGIDPVLRKSIWQYLVTLAQKEMMTVIITTHYTDEARLATLVGFLRHGRMLAEDSPASLMKKHGTDSLEDVFLILAQREGGDSPPQSHVHSSVMQVVGKVFGNEPGEEGTQYSFLASVVRRKAKRPLSVDKKDTSRSIARIKAMFHKNVVKIKRNVGLLLYSFLLPSVEVMLFCSVVGKVPFDMVLAVVNEDTPAKHSIRFLQLVDATIMPQVNYSALKPALDAVAGGIAYGVVHMKPDFSVSLERRLRMGYVIDNATATSSSIDVYLDMSNQQIYLTMTQYLRDASQKMIVEMFVQANLNPDGLKSVLNLKQAVYGSKNSTFTEFVAPGMILTITYIMAVGYSVSSLLEERTDGLLERCTVAGVQSFEVVSAHVMSQIFVIVVQDLLLLFVGFFIFRLPSRGPLWVVIALTLSQGICGMSLGLMISSLFESPAAAGMLSVGLNYPSMILSGILWPLEGIPREVRWFSYLLPQTIPSESFRSVIYKGWTITHINVWMGFVVTYTWAIIFLTATVLFFKQ